jgi:hypothetical protein
MEQTESIESVTVHAERDLDKLLDWIGKYDNRAAILFTLDTAMVGTLALRLNSSKFTAYNLLPIVASILLGISVIGIAITIFPRLNGPKDSLIYFGSIAKMKKTEFKDSFVNMTKTRYLDDLLAQCHINAKILDRKFKVFRISLAISMVAVIFWSLSLYLL